MSIIHVGNGVYCQLGDGLFMKGLCTPCTEGVYKPVSLLVAQAQNERRAQRWSEIMLEDDSNGFPRTSAFMRSNPLKGAFGENL